MSAVYIINSHPLTFVSLEAEDDDALTANQLPLGSADGYKPLVTSGSNARQCWCSFSLPVFKRWVKEVFKATTTMRRRVFLFYFQ